MATEKGGRCTQCARSVALKRSKLASKVRKPPTHAMSDKNRPVDLADNDTDRVLVSFLDKREKSGALFNRESVKKSKSTRHKI